MERIFGVARKWVKPRRFRNTRQTNLLGFFVQAEGGGSCVVGEKHQQRRPIVWCQVFPPEIG
jgi:hypothetical protein